MNHEGDDILKQLVQLVFAETRRIAAWNMTHRISLSFRVMNHRKRLDPTAVKLIRIFGDETTRKCPSQNHQIRQASLRQVRNIRPENGDSFRSSARGNVFSPPL